MRKLETIWNRSFGQGGWSSDSPVIRCSVLLRDEEFTHDMADSHSCNNSKLWCHIVLDSGNDKLKFTVWWDWLQIYSWVYKFWKSAMISELPLRVCCFTFWDVVRSVHLGTEIARLTPCTVLWNIIFLQQLCARTERIYSLKLRVCYMFWSAFNPYSLQIQYQCCGTNTITYSLT